MKKRYGVTYNVSIGFGGGLADFIVLDQTFLYHLPDNVPLEIGALIEPLAVAWHAVKMSNFEPGQSVLILGVSSHLSIFLPLLLSHHPTMNLS